MIDVKVLRAAMANSRRYLDNCDAVLCIPPGRPLGVWHLASRSWGLPQDAASSKGFVRCDRIGSDGNCSSSAV